MQRVVITGGTGLIGQAWLQQLGTAVDVTCIGRNITKIRRLLPQVAAVDWRDRVGLRQAIASADVVINLAGENIGQWWWTASQKQRILNSRIEATTCVVRLMIETGSTAHLINASAIGTYGLQPTIEAQQRTVYVETSPLPAPPQDFLAEVGAAWEAPLQVAAAERMTITTCRFAVVLAKQGGVLGRLLLPFRLGLGGVIGTGEQPFSWVTIHDVVRVLNHVIAHRVEGVINVVSPNWITQKQFARSLGQVLRRPTVLPMPAAVVKALFGEMGNLLLLQGQAVVSQRLPNMGKALIQHGSIEQALTALLQPATSG